MSLVREDNQVLEVVFRNQLVELGASRIVRNRIGGQDNDTALFRYRLEPIGSPIDLLLDGARMLVPTKLIQEEAPEVERVQVRPCPFPINGDFPCLLSAPGNRWPGLGILIPVVVYDTEPRFFPQGHRKLDDGFIVSAGLHLAVQYLRGALPQRMLIDVLHRTLELLGIEERALDGVRVAFEPLIRPKPGTRGSPQTAANGLFLDRKSTR